MSKKKTAVVILNWNGVKYLQKFIPAAVKYTIDAETDLYVADNGSDDNSVSWLQKNFPEVKLILFDKNYGFTGGYNSALKQIEAEYFVLLNSDVEVTANWVKAPVNLLDENPEIAVVMPKILSYDNKKMFEYAGAAGGFIDKFGYPFCRGRIISRIEHDNSQYDNVSEIFWASGAAFFVRAKLYLDFGGLDEDFFAHMEEIDLCWRLKNSNHKIFYTPQSVVYHVGGGALPSNNPQKIYLNFRNNLFLLYKNLPRKKLFLTIFIRLILDGLSAFVYLAQRNFSFFVAVIRAHFAFYAGIKKMTRKRNSFSSENHIEIFNKSVVFQFYIKKNKTFDKLNFK